MANSVPSPSSAMQGAHNNAYAGREEMWAGERDLINYNNDLVAKMSRYAGAARDALEFGAGIGCIARLWHARTQVKPDCLEIDDVLRAVLVERQFQSYDSLDALTKKYDLIYSSNVLEHIEDDVAILKQLHATLNPGGTLVVFVPAFMMIYTPLDASVGHYRRYGRAELLQKLQLADFDVQTSYYVDSIGFFAWWAVKLRGYKPDHKLGAGNGLAIYDKFIYPVSKLLDWLGLRYLFGKNVLVVAKKR